MKRLGGATRCVENHTFTFTMLTFFPASFPFRPKETGGGLAPPGTPKPIHFSLDHIATTAGSWTGDGARMLGPAFDKSVAGIERMRA